MHRKDEIFADFINKAEILGDKDKRKELLDILYTHFFESDYYTVDRLEKLTTDKRWHNYIDVLIEISRDKSLRMLTQGNEPLATKVVIDVAFWIEERYQEFRKNKHVAKLKQDYKSFVKNSNIYSEQDWLKLLEELKEMYPDASGYWEFYKNKIVSITRNKETTENKEKDEHKNKKELEAVKNSLKDEYNRALLKRICEIEKRELAKSLYTFKKELAKHERRLSEFIEAIGKIYSFVDGKPFIPGRFWDLSLSSFAGNIDWNVIDRYAKILEKNEQIRKLAEMLGRLREAEEKYETELIENTNIMHEWKVNSTGKSEIKGIHFSDDLNNLLPSEISLLSIAETEILFAKRFAEKKLLTFYYDDKYRVEKEVPEMIEKKKKKEDEKGPIIACVDTSGSMSGTPETVAKTVILALLRIALRDNRRCYLISFSTQIETLEITDMQHNLDKLMSFMQKGFHGGTDATPALEEALKMLKKENYKKADVVMISDFIMSDLPEDLKNKIIEQKQNKTKFHSIVISQEANPDVIDIFDNSWVIDFRDYNDLSVTIRNIESNS